MSASLRSAFRPLLLLLLLPSIVAGAFIKFQNCLNSSIRNSNPLQLQFVPLYVDANFDRQDPYTLNVTIYGNVSGQQYVGTYPPPDSPYWKNDSSQDVLGKIPNTGDQNVNTTLFAKFEVLTYSAYDARASSFCPHLVNGSCPLSPYFFANRSDPYELPAVRVSHGLGSPYMFSTLSSNITIISGDNHNPELGCVLAGITPDLGPQIKSLITWLPAAILILKGLATLTAAIWSPWGSSDIFRWSSNYGRDEDLLRLVTPGFGDCLQYIQFATLMGSLSLQFPGFFQPALSQTAWSLLLFNQSFVSHGNGTQSLVDGVYATNGTYGLDTMRQLIGMTEAEDIWADMAIWLAVIALVVIVLCQIGFFGRWIYRTATKTTEEDLRRKNLPFTLGNMVRLLFNFFILPIVALSLFQLVISPVSPPIVVAFAVVLFVILIVAAGWIMRVIFTAKPRTFLFDDMPTVLLYGPLYNTYSDSAAPFTLVPVLITFMRGVAFGAVQPSGTGQIIILAICEVILILTLNGFRPFQNQTSMNAYHTFFAVARLITVLLCVAFVPSLGVTQSPRGWIGYTILLIHACVLVFGFFLNAAQTLIEVSARSLGLAGRDAQTGAVRGSILSWRMLKKRKTPPVTAERASMMSSAAILRTSHGDEARSWNGDRSRSMSASSQQLLNQTTPSANRLSGVEGFSSGGDGNDGSALDNDGYGPKPALGVKAEETFYRPPRPRKNTIDMLHPGAKSRSVGSTSDFPYQDSPGQSSGKRGSGYEGTGSPAPAYLRERADSDLDTPRTDYAVREVDQYYRGPALSDQPTRKLKTGPADPEGPAASAQSWFQRLLFGVKGNKNKDQGKGFEVVRTSRLPPGLQQGEGNAGDESMELQTSPPMHQEPYRDVPDDDERSHSRDLADRPVSPLRDDELGSLDKGHRRLVSYISEDGQQLRGYARDQSRSSQGTNKGLRPDSDTVQIPSTAAHQASGLVGEDRTASMHPGMREEQLVRDRSVDLGSKPRSSDETDASSEHDDARSSTEHRDDLRYSTLAPSLAPIETVGEITLPSRFNSSRSGNLDQVPATSGQGWLRDVDNLSWDHTNPSHAQPASSGGPDHQSQDSASTNRTLVPGIPTRSDRRHLSADSSAAGDHAAGSSRIDNFDFGGFDVNAATPPSESAVPVRSDNNANSTSPYLFATVGEATQPGASFRTTSHHRAGDSISRNSFGANAALQASSAEIMEEERVSPPTQYRGDIQGQGWPMPEQGREQQERPQQVLLQQQQQQQQQQHQQQQQQHQQHQRQAPSQSQPTTQRSERRRTFQNF